MSHPETIAVYSPVVRRSAERWHEQGVLPPLDYTPGKPLGVSRFEDGRWVGPLLALEFGIAPSYPDRAALIDAVTAAAGARGMPILIRASSARHASRSRHRRNALLRAALDYLETTPAAS